MNNNKITNESKHNKNKNDIKYNNNNFLINDNIIFSNSIKIYKCFYYYFQFKKNLEIIQYKNESMEIFLVNKSWFNAIKGQCDYYKIKKQNNILKENIANDLAKRFPLNPKILENKPKPVKIEIIRNNEFYYYDYDFFDENTVFNCSSTFKIIKNDNIFIKVKVYIKK